MHDGKVDEILKLGMAKYQALFCGNVSELIKTKKISFHELYPTR
jgi:hypothetical protein